MHEDVVRLWHLRRDAEGESRQRCLVRVHAVDKGAGKKRARPTPMEPGAEYIKSVALGGRGNFLPVEAPVIYKRSGNPSTLQRDVEDREPEVLAKVSRIDGQHHLMS